MYIIIITIIERFHSRDQQPYWITETKENRVQFPEDYFGTPSWPPFLCFGTPTWPPWRDIKTLYSQKKWLRAEERKKDSNTIYKQFQDICYNISSCSSLQTREYVYVKTRHAADFKECYGIFS